jgi:hypothetical protein
MDNKINRQKTTVEENNHPPTTKTANILHTLPHIRLTFTTLPWKQNPHLLQRPLLAAEY